MAEHTAGLSPIESLQLWEMLRHGLNTLPQSGQREHYVRLVLPLKVLSIGVAMIAVVGVGLMLAGYGLRRRNGAGTVHSRPDRSGAAG